MEMFRFVQEKDHWVLWENEEIGVVIQWKTNFPARYGGHVVVEQRLGVQTPYQDYWLFAEMSIVAAAVQKGLEELGLASHANIQSNANWAFLNPDGSLRDIEEGRQARGLHIHVYGRSPQDPGWGEPIRPAYYKEQQEGRFWGKVFSGEQMRKLSLFICKEMSRFVL